MTQNIYDDPKFFAGYSALRRSIEGLAGAPEWPALQALLPPVRGLRVLDLGCGFGWFCRWAAQEGAAHVCGVDISDNMLARARQAGGQAIQYVKGDLERLRSPGGRFDLVYSSLAFHYVENLAGLVITIAGCLVPGGRLVFSVEHPIFTAPAHPRWSSDEDGTPSWPIAGYLIEGARTTNWLAEGVIKRHRLIGTYLDLLIERGLTISHVEEWRPTPEQIAAQPELAIELNRPMFLLISARK